VGGSLTQNKNYFVITFALICICTTI